MKALKHGVFAILAFLVAGGVATAQCARGWAPCGTAPGPLEGAEIEAWDPDGDGPLNELLVCTSWTQVADFRPPEAAFAWDGTHWIQMGGSPWPVEHPRALGETLIAYRSIDPSIMSWNQSLGRWLIIAPAPNDLEDLAPLPDGDVLITWSYGQYGGQNYIARWDAQSATYTSAGQFGPRVRKLIRANGRVYASGEFTEIDGQPSTGLARYEPDTNTWTNVPRPPGAQSNATELKETEDALYAVYNSVAYRQDLATGQWLRLTVGFNTVQALVPLPSGEVLGVGQFRGTGTPTPYSALATYSPAANAWTPLATRATSLARSAVLMSDGSVMVASEASWGNPFPPLGDDHVWGLGVVRWDPVERRVHALGDGLPSPPKHMVGLEDGSVLCGGDFPSAGDVHTGSIVRFDPIARTYASAGAELFVQTFALNRAASGEIRCLSTLSDGTAGVFAWDAASNTWNARGSRWSTVGLLSYGALGETGDGTIVVWDSSRLLAWDESTGGWRTGPSLQPTNHKVGLARGAGQSVIVAAGNVVRWDLSTTVLEPIGDEGTTAVWQLTELSNGDLLATGDQIRRWHRSANEWSGVRNATGRLITFAAELPDGDLIIGSYGLTATGFSGLWGDVYRWDALTDRFSYLSMGVDDAPACGVVFSNSTVILGGAIGFGRYSMPSPWFARYDLSCPLHTTLQPTTQYACRDQPIRFSTGAFSVYPLSLQWRRNNAPLAETPGRFEGTTTTTLTVYDRRDSGTYTCVITDQCGSITTPLVRLINCIGDYDCSQGVDSDDTIAYFADWQEGLGDADINRDGDVDGDDVLAFFAAWDAGC